MTKQIIIDVETLYAGSKNAKLDDLPVYEARAKEQADLGNSVVLTGQGPIWLYLRIAHVLHGKVTKLSYNSPVTGEVEIFDHTPY